MLVLQIEKESYVEKKLYILYDFFICYIFYLLKVELPFKGGWTNMQWVFLKFGCNNGNTLQIKQQRKQKIFYIFICFEHWILPFFYVLYVIPSLTFKYQQEFVNQRETCCFSKCSLCIFSKILYFNCDCPNNFWVMNDKRGME